MALKAGRVGVNPNYVDKEGRPLYDNSYLKELLRKEGIITLFTKEGNPISIDNAVEGHLYSCIVTLTPKQAGTGDPSPTNVRAITGYDTLKITANSVDTDYSFDSTVYGGVFDVSSGLLTVTHAYVDLGTLTYYKYDTLEGALFRGEISGIKQVTSLFRANDNYCSAYKVVSTSMRTNLTASQNLNNAAIDIIDNNYTDADVFKAAMDGVQLVYELATPTTVQLTPAQIALVTGSNTVSATSGTSLDVQYLGTLVPGGANGRSLNRSLNLNREVIEVDERKEIQEEVKEVKEVPVEEPVTVKKSTRKTTTK